VLIHNGKIDEAPASGGDGDSTRRSRVQSPKSNVQGQTQKQIPDSKFKIQIPNWWHRTLVGEHRLKSCHRDPGGWGRFCWLMKTHGSAGFRNCLRFARWTSSTICFFGKKVHFDFGSGRSAAAGFHACARRSNRVVMEGIHRADEMARLSHPDSTDRALLELGTGWTASLPAGKATRQLLYFLEKRMSVAEILLQHAFVAFEVYAQLYELVKDGWSMSPGSCQRYPTQSARCLICLMPLRTYCCWRAVN